MFSAPRDDIIGVGTATGVNYFTLPNNTNPFSATVGPGGIWFLTPTSLALYAPGPGLYNLPLPSGFSPSDLTLGRDGNFWITGRKNGTGTVMRVAVDGRMTEFSLGTMSYAVPSIVTGPDNAVWLINQKTPTPGTTTYTAELVRITYGGTIARYDPFPNRLPDRIVSGYDGYLWVYEYDTLYRISTNGQVTTRLLTPTTGTWFMFTSAPDGNLWFAQSFTGPEGLTRITPTGTATTYPIKSPDIGGYGIDLPTATDAGYVWVWNRRYGSLGRFGPISTCAVACSASAPNAATTTAEVQFTSNATVSGCLAPHYAEWRFGDNGTAYGANPRHTYKAPGVYQWTVTISAGEQTCTRSGTITIANTSCALACAVPQVPLTGTVETPIAFTGSATPSGCTGTPAYTWTFGDNTTSTQANATHAYTQPGTYTWTFAATIDGVTCTKTGTIMIATSSTDTDADGLPDEWERNGLTTDVNGQTVFLDLPAMGANPLHKDLFVHVDYMEKTGTGGHTHEPKQQAIARIIEAFANAPLTNPDGTTGVNIHIDCGPSCTMNPTGVRRIANDVIVDGPFWAGRSRAKRLAHIDRMGAVGFEDFFALRDKHFPKERRPVFHYCLFGHQLGGLTGFIVGDVSGMAPPGGPDFFITLASFGEDPAGSVLAQAGTFMHELGHTLGLEHGGDQLWNRKPNYLSVMNYSFQHSGLIKDGQQGLLDYSRFTLPTLDESSLREDHGLQNNNPNGVGLGTIYYAKRNSDTLGLIATTLATIDWNFNGRIDTSPVTADINDGLGSTLTGYNDWTSLRFDKHGIGSLSVATQTTLAEPTIDEMTPSQAAKIPALHRIAIANPGATKLKKGSTGTVSFRIANTGSNPVTLVLDLAARNGTPAQLPNRNVTIAPNATLTVPVAIGPLRGTTEVVTLRAFGTNAQHLVDESTLTVTEDGSRRRAARHPSPCAYSIGPPTASFPAAGGTGSVNVTAAPGCSWIATSNVEWITMQGSRTGVGVGSVSYSIASNTGPGRTGAISIAGQTATITQAGGGTANLVINGAFDRDLASWNEARYSVPTGTGTFTWASDDAAGQQSGSAKIMMPTASHGQISLWQCVPLPLTSTGRTYEFSGDVLVKIVTGPDFEYAGGAIAGALYATPDCTGPAPIDARGFMVKTASPTWQQQSVTMLGNGTERSCKISVSVYDYAGGQVAQFDNVTLKP